MRWSRLRLTCDLFIFFFSSRRRHTRLQGDWSSDVCSSDLVLPRIYDPAARRYGNLYSNLLDYVISAALVFYILTIAGLFRLRTTRPGAERPYSALGYPFVPAFYILGAGAVLIALFA